MESGDPATAAGLLLLDLVEQQQARNADAYFVNYTVFSSHSPPRTNFVAEILAFGSTRAVLQF